MKHFLKPIGHCLTTAVVTSAVLEAYSLPALPTTNADLPASETASDSTNQAVSLPTQPVPAPSPASIASPGPLAATAAPPAPSTAPVSQPEVLAPSPATVSSSDFSSSGLANPNSSHPSASATPATSAAPFTLPNPIAPTTTDDPARSAPVSKLEPKTDSDEPASIDNVVNLDALPDAEPPLAAPESSAPASTAPDSNLSSPPVTPPLSNETSSDVEDLAAAKQVLETELAALVERDRPAREAQFQQNLVVSALLYAQLGEFDLARRTAQHPSLPPDVQTETLAKIDQMEAKQQEQLPDAASEAQIAQTPPLTVNPTQPISIPQQWRASRTPMIVRPTLGNLNNQCLPRVTVDPTAPAQGAIASSPEQDAIEIGKTFAALVASSQLAASPLDLAQPTGLTTPLASDFSTALDSDSLNAEATPAVAEIKADFKLEQAVESTLSKSLDKVGRLAPATVPVAVKSAFDWWTLLATGEVVFEALGDIPDGAIAPATQIESVQPDQPEMVAVTESQLAKDALFTVLEQHLPKTAGKIGEAPKALAVQQSSPADANCAGTQPIYSNAAFSVNTAALSNLQWGRIAFPLPIPAAITSAFGWRIHPISGDRRFHAGIDIGAPTGTPVVAALSGRVVAADYMGGYGLAVIIENPEAAQRHLYAHLSGIAVQPGMTLEQGNVLGWVGSTGNSTGPHLHFETQVLTTDGWVAIDPIGVAAGAGVAVSRGQ